MRTSTAGNLSSTCCALRHDSALPLCVLHCQLKGHMTTQMVMHKMMLQPGSPATALTLHSPVVDAVQGLQVRQAHNMSGAGSADAEAAPLQVLGEVAADEDPGSREALL